MRMFRQVNEVNELNEMVANDESNVYGRAQKKMFTISAGDVM